MSIWCQLSLVLLGSAVVVFLAIRDHKRKARAVEIILRLFARQLNSAVKKGLGGISLKGTYQGRVVTCSWGDTTKDGRGVTLRIRMIPHRLPEKRPLFTVSDPAPTENTRLVSKEVVHEASWTTDPNKAYDENYIRGILDELREAVEIVESGDPYHKKAKH